MRSATDERPPPPGSWRGAPRPVLDLIRKSARRLGVGGAFWAARSSGAFRILIRPTNFWRRIRSRKTDGLNEKIRYKMARDRRPILTVFGDKLEAREYVRRTVGPEFAPVTLAEGSAASDLPWGDLPDEMAVKVSHGAGGCVISSWRGSEPGATVPEARLANAWTRASVSPSAFDPVDAAAFLDMHLPLSYFWTQGEWGYRDVRPRVLAEEFLPGEGGGLPVDYRMYCFDGGCEAIMVISGQVEPPRDGRVRYLADFFLPDWTHLDGLREGSAHHETVPERPDDLDRMLAVSNALSEGQDFLRVDLIRSGGRVLVSELTNYPNAGQVRTNPRSFERWLGSHWKLPSDYSTLPQGSYPLPPLDDPA